MEDKYDSLFLTQFLTHAAPPHSIKPYKTKLKKGDYIAERYKIFKIQEGGMGVLFFCFDKIAGHSLAIKTYKETGSPDILEQFRSEALTWIRLGENTNIVQANYVLDIDGKPHVFMEYVAAKDNEDPTLRRCLLDGALSMEKSLDLAIQFCKGMIHVTSVIPGLTHKDIKPENILITSDGTLKITDFGLTKVYMNSSSFLQPVGTFPYMSPEQCLGMEIFDTRSDIYSFGIVLYEMLTGQRPFNDDKKGLIKKHIGEIPTPASHINPRIPIELNDIVMRCIEKKAEDRFESFLDLKKALIKIYPENKIKCYNSQVSESELDAFKAESFSNRGTSFITLGKYEEAIGFFENALKLDPNYIEAYYRMAMALIGLGKYEEALQNLENYLKINPKNAEILNHKGSLLNLQGKREEALDCFDKAIQLHHWCPQARYNKGVTLFMQEKYVDAYQVLESIEEESYQKNKNLLLSLCEKKVFKEDYKPKGDLSDPTL